MSLSEKCPIAANHAPGSETVRHCTEIVEKLAAFEIFCAGPQVTPKPPKNHNPFSPIKIFNDSGEFLGTPIPKEVKCGVSKAIHTYIEEKGIQATAAQVEAIMVEGDMSVLEQNL